MIVVAEVVVVLGLLGVWGYKLAAKNLASDAQEPNSPNEILPQTSPATNPPATNRARETDTRKSSPVATKPARVASVSRDSSPLPALHSPVLLVEKSKQRLTVFDDGWVVKRYSASTGRDAGDKTREGDYRTPEGEFYVCVKNAKSQYTRALGLSYPDAADAQRGLRDGLITRRDHDRIVEAIRRRRQPPWDTPLGGAIMIHGDRRGGRTTQGCIALEDRDILELFPQIPLGTRVVIRP
jgi:murein L,D-transpeptidase YafK